MLFRKLTLLTFIAAQGLFVSGENMITCEGDIHRLTCDTGLIKVKSSLYGRTYNDTCSFNWSPSEVVNTSCSLKISTIADRCNGLRECELKTDLFDTPDPCYGTYKYYNTTYDCINGRVTVICEHGYSTLDCEDGSIQIINANYGRADSVTCSNGLSNNLIKNTNCYAPNTLSTVAALCNGQRRCTVEASHKIFTDPCSETVKYLTVSYICTRETVTCEGNIAVLTCDADHLKIVSANYGRTDSTTCSSGRPLSQISYTNCYTPNALNGVAARCEGKSSCVVPATNDVFSDPCVGTYKYLTVVYICI
ncbi:rhamnose-binding lectin isoform X1 [Ictalurus furcatus]|uniref:rhamnose-binding lectin isoform X1 n=1 Tax=Ictalurus furcatus TaxID=66913 RepID=UPI002350AC20|nr:rhamnose-binding lectin isoform X1 [Ictalurus furcatus]XP_053480496.1 rhamnose-binding lectin isoform X1 [Ictalurus furcatus]XP_053480497.1 rhamnose-binding lectin isoform X1 [Ictalurus furcatus]XP_053480498.1 rhamnose-binding lectin isoform X1 [Ictalurus furcatus]XP_053480499.1 rhamnose-binding lectin isoform X1 [Ictalurus furcatus]